MSEINKAERTRQHIIEKTAPLFNVKGYAGTSLTDITSCTGLTKGSVYGNFANKEEVAIAAYEYNTGKLNERVKAVMDVQESATGKLQAMLDYYRTNWKDIFAKGGCPILNAAIEADDNLAFLKKNVQNSIKSWANRIIKIIEQGKQSGEFKKNLIAEDYAYTMITLIEGGIMLAKITSNQNRLFAALDRVVAIIHSEMKK